MNDELFSDFHVCFYAQHGDLQPKISLLCVHWLLCFFVAGLGAGKCCSSCRLTIDPHSEAPLCSLGAYAECLGSPGPDAIDGYLFSVVCCKRACALACQTPQIALEQCSDRLGHADSSRAPETSDEVTSHCLVALISSNDPHWQPLLHYTIAAGARVIA